MHGFFVTILIVHQDTLYFGFQLNVLVHVFCQPVKRFKRGSIYQVRYTERALYQGLVLQCMDHVGVEK